MDNRNFPTRKFHVDESLQPQGPRRFKTSTPRGRRPNPYTSPNGGFGGPGSSPNEEPFYSSWRPSNNSWRSRDSSRNSSRNSSFNSTYNSPGGPGHRYQGASHREQETDASTGVKYFHPSMTENPWRHLESNALESAQSASFNAESIESSEGDKINENSDQEAHSPDVYVESVTECSQDLSIDEPSISDVSSSQKSTCQ